MKKTIIITLLLISILVIAGCGQEAQTTDTTGTGGDNNLGNEVNGDIDSDGVNDLDDVEVNPDDLF